MAANLLTSKTQGSGASLVTASITPTPNALILAAVFSDRGVGADIPTLAGNGMTWVQEETDTVDASTRRLTLFRAMSSSPSAGTVTASWSGSQTRSGIIVIEVTDVSTGGTNGSGAVIQSNSVAPVTGVATSLSVTLGAFQSSANASVGFIYHGTAETTTPGSGFSVVGEVTGNSIGLMAEYKTTADTSVDASWATGSFSIGIAIEVKEVITLLPSSITSAQTFGTTILGWGLNLSGMTSQFESGTLILTHVLPFTGVISSEAFGFHVVGHTYSIGPPGIESSEAVGTAYLYQQIRMVGIESGSAFGTPHLVHRILMSGIPTGVAFGTVLIRGNLYLVFYYDSQTKGHLMSDSLTEGTLL